MLIVELIFVSKFKCVKKICPVPQSLMIADIVAIYSTLSMSRLPSWPPFLNSLAFCDL